MMEKISQLMDGELDAQESRREIRRMGEDLRLTDGWDTYHLIRDVLRDETDLGPSFLRRVHERLEQEPVIVAPHTRLSHRITRYTLPMAAGLAGVVVVGWLALSTGQDSPPKVAQGAPAQPRVPAVHVPSTDRMGDYLRAHQEFSPSTAMQGVASYVRTVASDEPPAAQ